MTDTNTSGVNTGGIPPGNVLSYNPIVGSSSIDSFGAGKAMAQSASEDGTVVPANASSSGTLPRAIVTGLAAGTGVVGGRVVVQQGGVLSLTTAEWDAVLSTEGGLTTGATYWLAASFPGNAGNLTPTRPTASGTFAVQVGMASSPTDMVIQIGFPIENL